MKLWLMLIGGKGRLRYIKAEPPCWKGEIVVPFLGDCLVFGWQKAGASGAAGKGEENG